MSLDYDSIAAAAPPAPWNITLLSQRDASAYIPLNYIEEPGVSATAACFALNRYETTAFQQCLVNLFTSYFERLHFDVYWDSRLQEWSFCPVQLPLSQGQSLSLTSTTTLAHSSSLPTSLSATSLTSAVARNLEAVETVPASPVLDIRDTSSSLASATSSPVSPVYSPPPTQITITVSTTTAQSTTLAVYPAASLGAETEVLYAVGPYVCSTGMDMLVLIELLDEYLRKTNNILFASIKYLTFHLHNAALDVDPTAPPPSVPSSDLPNLQHVFEGYFNNLSPYLYTPSILASDRANLNNSWFAPNASHPGIGYYSVEPISPSSSEIKTEDGWPTLYYVTVNKNTRVLVAYGTIDSEVGGPTNFDSSDTIFVNDTLSRKADVSASANGDLTSGCVYDANSPTVAAANSSWLISTYETNVNDTNGNIEYPVAFSLAKCGISPVLNDTVSNTTADLNATAYQQFIYSSVWSWAPGQPGGFNPPDGANNTVPVDNRCAIFNSSFGGSWWSAPCKQKYQAACQDQNDPLVWHISSGSADYSMVATTFCNGNTVFSVPHNPVENRYLLEAFINADLSDGDAIWINFNSLDTVSCWVTGLNAICPYVQHSSEAGKIYIPTVAALIILIIAGMTLFVKVGSNRARSKRRRRVLEGWSYEGVPN